VRRDRDSTYLSYFIWTRRVFITSLRVLPRRLPRVIPKKNVDIPSRPESRGDKQVSKISRVLIL